MANEDYTTLPQSWAEAKSSGSRYYYTGRPCPRGHSAPRFTSAQTCTACAKENQTISLHGSLEAAREFAEKFEAERIARKTQVCSVDGCLAFVRKRGMCDMHYQRFMKNGSAGSGARKKAERGAPTLLHCGKAQCPAAKRLTTILGVLRNPEMHYQSRRRFRDENVEKLRAVSAAYYQQNSGAIKANVKTWVEANPERYRANNARNLAKYREYLRRATPSWVDWKAIDAFYAACPKGWHVDHILPVRGKLVSGLHVLANLQYLPASDNCSKSNRFNPADHSD